MNHPLAYAVPVPVMADSYKASHPFQYPEAKRMISYGEFRWGFERDRSDTRIVHYGIRHIVENYLHRKWSREDLVLAKAFYETHRVGGTSMPWPEELFSRIIDENDGYFPIKVQALMEGTCTNARVPSYQITSEGVYAPLCTFLETLITHLWYPCTVATLSRRARDIVEAGFEKSCDEGRDSALIMSRLHDFGMRGCTTLEQAIIGGTAHLINFEGTDTMPAAYYAQMKLNDGRPVGFSIPATEHSVMMSWPSEKRAILNMIEQFGSSVFACVMDSFDYVHALEAILPSIHKEKINKGGFMVLRPDSGDPVEAVLMALRAAEKVFGCQINSKGYKVICGCGVIQGDGIDTRTMERICAAVIEDGYSVENVAFGMGAGLLQKVNRDTMGFATKLSYIEYPDGSGRDVMKCPKTDTAKFSLPGALAVKQSEGVPTVFPSELVAECDDMLEVVYDCGPIDVSWPCFDDIRRRVKAQWEALPRSYDPISLELKTKIQSVSVCMTPATFDENIEES